MGSWTLDEISWDRFDRSKLDPEIVRIVKAASLVEYNGGAYAHHLCRVFHDDPDFQQGARRWGEEEIQHGKALARWAVCEASPRARSASIRSTSASSASAPAGKALR